MNEVQRYLIEEFVEEYHERRLSRRELLRRAALIMGGAAAAATALREVERALAAQPASRTRSGVWPTPLADIASPERAAGTMPPPERTDALVVPPDDPAILVEVVTFPGEVGEVSGYRARPAMEGSFPGVVVIHENRGLIEPNMDIARRFAKAGYVALAPDLLSRVGGTEQFLEDLAQATAAIGQLGPDAPAADGNAAVAFLRTLPFVSGALGAVGYCFGGGVVWRMGVRNPELAAIAPYYGPPPPLAEVPNLRAAALGIYAELDSRINSGSEALWEALRTAGKTFELWIARGANHAFFNNTGASYAPEAAAEAWLRTLGWFDQYLGGRPLTGAQPGADQGGGERSAPA